MRAATKENIKASRAKENRHDADDTAETAMVRWSTLVLASDCHFMRVIYFFND